MRELRNIITPLHTMTKRNYLERMNNDKVACSKVARSYGKDYWDGDRKYGYGGYEYDGRWKAVAKDLIDIYGLNNDSGILDVGCGKGFLLYEIKQLLPGAAITGFDISSYALERSKKEIRPALFELSASDKYPFEDKEWDLVISLTTLHNLPLKDLKHSLSEIERVGRNKYITMESYRNESELFNLQCWALTCESFFRSEEWEFLFDEFGYTGDYEFIYFE